MLATIAVAFPNASRIGTPLDPLVKSVVILTEFIIPRFERCRLYREITLVSRTKEFLRPVLGRIESDLTMDMIDSRGVEAAKSR